MSAFPFLQSVQTTVSPQIAGYFWSLVFVVKGLEMPVDMILGLTYLGIEKVNGKECVVLDVTMNMEMEMFGEPMSITREGKEWIGEDGIPVKMDLDGQGEVAGMEIPMCLLGVLTGETVYEGHDCWVFTMTQKSEMGGVSSEIEMVIYLDKETLAPVHMTLSGEGMEQDTGYIEPILPTESSTWELGPEETITTPLGTYKCQVIYIMEEEKRVGTIWATQDIRAPLKYMYVYETEDSKLEMTIVLVEYSSG
jgi:hypothetical protein